MTTGIHACGLVVGHNRAPLLADVTLSIRPGERWFLLGANGAGKTSLLRTLFGLLRPTRGELTRTGRLAFVAQFSPLRAHIPLSVGEAARLAGASAAQAQQALIDWGAGELTKRSLFRLSGGERGRVLLAGAFATNPEIIGLDEPTAHLDESGQTHLESVLASSPRLATVIATHDREWAQRQATHTAIVVNGRVQLEHDS